MAIGFTYTNYQLGTLAYWELCKPNSHQRAHSILVLLRTARIVDDESEAWLRDYPFEKIISREDAAYALTEIRGKSDWQKQYEQIEAAKSFVTQRDEILKNLDFVQDSFRLALKNILAREIASEDLNASIALFMEHKLQTDTRHQRFVAMNPPSFPWEQKVPTRNLDNEAIERRRIQREREADSAKKYAIAQEKERRAMEIMRQTIAWVERKKSRD